jgi:LysM repeat protein
MVSASTTLWAKRVAAPVAFLLAATIAVLLVRSALDEPPVVTPPAAPSTAAPRSYVVKRGDTLGRIARRFDTSVAALRRLNPQLDPNALPVGLRIRVQ